MQIRKQYLVLNDCLVLSRCSTGSMNGMRMNRSNLICKRSRGATGSALSDEPWPLGLSAQIRSRYQLRQLGKHGDTQYMQGMSGSVKK